MGFYDSLANFAKKLVSNGGSGLKTYAAIKNPLGYAITNWDEVSNVLNQFGEGLKNAWYQFSGQEHLTPAYQHREQIELNKNQLTAQDMEKAGLSKFAMTGTSVGNPQASSGKTVMDAIMQSLQIGNAMQELKERKYNLDLSENLGIRTGDSNALAPYAAIAKILFGVGIDEIPEGGLLSLLFPSDSGGSTAGAAADALGATMSTAGRSNFDQLFGVPITTKYTGGDTNAHARSLIQASLKMKLDNLGRFDPSSVSAVVNSGHPDNAMNALSLKIHHDEMFDEIGDIALGQPKGLDMSSILTRYTHELEKEGLTHEQALGFAGAWLRAIMDEYGYTYDEKDKKWYYDH